MLGLARCCSLPIRHLCLVMSLAGLSPAQSFSIATNSSLPAGTAGVPYSVTLMAVGGFAPYSFSVAAGSSLPAGLTLSAAGLLSGAPVSSGTFGFTMQASDAAPAPDMATAALTLKVNAGPVSIATQPPLFAGIVAQPYAQPLVAANGTPPYTWTIVSGASALTAEGLTLNSVSGGEVLSGTPQTAGTFTFTVQVTDASHGTAQQTFSIAVSVPMLTLSPVGALPSGTTGAAYSQKLPLLVTGGVSPYTWSLTSTPVPGLTFDPTGVALNGAPTTAGTYTVAVMVTDAAGNTANKSLTLAIAAGALTITTPSQLPSGQLGASYSQSFTAVGGAPPYTWSATGLPAGLTLNSTTGAVSGTLTGAGPFQVVVTVTDSALTSFKNLFTISVSYPPAPAITFSGLPAAASPAQQCPLQISLAAAYPVDISGQAILTFSPGAGPADDTIQFASGGTSASFTVPAGATTPVSSVPLALQTGTVAGTLTVSLHLQAGGVDITPSPAPSMTTQIAPAAPVISSLQTTVGNNSLSVVVTGYSTAREVTQAVFTFSAATGQTLETSASSITVNVSTLFGTWFVDPANSRFGSQFIFTQPFTVQGNPAAVIPVSVTLTNPTGSVTKNF